MRGGGHSDTLSLLRHSEPETDWPGPESQRRRLREERSVNIVSGCHAVTITCHTSYCSTGVQGPGGNCHESQEDYRCFVWFSLVSLIVASSFHRRKKNNSSGKSLKIILLT